MQPEVSRYLEQQRKQEEADRAGVLRELGICRRVYLPEGTKLTAEAAQEYPYEEEGRRFEVEAISVTDEEWAAIHSALHQERLRSRKRRNPVSRSSGSWGSRCMPWLVCWASWPSWRQDGPDTGRQRSFRC